jgi:hypothetical protein
MQRIILLLLLGLSLATAAQAQEKYQRKSGLWEVKRTASRTEDQERTYQVCVDQASDNALRQLAGGMRSERCETAKAVREGDKIVVDATCKVAKSSTATTHAVITGKFDTAYKVESKSTFDPPLKGKTEGTAVMEAKWTGPCKSNQKPGDVILPSGAKVSSLTDEPPTKQNATKEKSSGRQKGRYTPPGVPPAVSSGTPPGTTPTTPPATK